MKWLKKINKGFALTIIVLIVLIIYLISNEAIRKAEKPNIETACREYIELINKYAVMPESIQKVYYTGSISYDEQTKLQNDANNAISSQMDKLEKELETKMIDNELAIDMQRDRIEEFVKNKNNIFTSIKTKFNKEIAKIKKIVFDENQVTVTFDSKVKEEVKYLDLEGNEMSKIDDFDIPEETITLQKVDDKWKVVYADLQYNNGSDSYYATTMSF